MKEKITVVGTGYVGLTLGVCLASLGHCVICVDKDKEKINKLKKGISPIFEPGVEDLLRKHKKNISFTTDIENSFQNSEIIFIAVGTPPKNNGNINMTFFWEVAKELKKISDKNHIHRIVAIKSTVPVGTSDKLADILGNKFSVVFNPEFLREGSAVKDFLNPDRIILGTKSEKAKKRILKIYSSISAPKVFTDTKSAELIKYASNSFLATKISFINEIANICEKVGANVSEVAEGVGLDKRIGKQFLNAGVGYGGSCFPKDVEALIKIADSKKYDFRILKAAFAVNEYQRKNFAGKIKKVLEKEGGKDICVWGLSFKPNTDDIRKSPAIEIIKTLQKEGYKIKAYDPVAIENAKKELILPNIEFSESPFLAAKGSDVLVLVTEWSEFLKTDMKKIKEAMRRPNIIDGRNAFDSKKMKRMGFYYEGVGVR